MTEQDMGESAPLTVDSVREAVERGLGSTEDFWQQFDRFELSLSHPFTSKEDGIPQISLRAEFHFPPNTPTPIIQKGEIGNQMNKDVAAAINELRDGLFVGWEPGFSGGNSRGWDINFYGILGEEVKELEIPEDDRVYLFEYDKPEDEPKNRQLSEQVHRQTFKLSDQDGPIIIGPQGAISMSDLEKARKARHN